MSETNNKDKQLIQKVRAFNMGYLGFPKYQWRGLGTILLFSGLGLILFSMIFPEKVVGMNMPELGFISAFFGGIIYLLNG